MPGTAGIGLVGLLSASAAGTTTAATSVKVTLAQPNCSHFTLTPQPKVARGGPVTFVVSNKGNLGHPTCQYGITNASESHQLVVLKTNLPPGKLPLKPDKSGFKVAVEVGRVAPALVVNPGQTRTVTLTLKPGKYVLICNVPSHYQAGQYSAFVVSG
jgi:uncharacterized cupredoxin-like copper-binding protein